MKTKKLINDPKNIIEEMLDGIVAAHPRQVKQLPHSPRSIVAVDGPRAGKVGLVEGGARDMSPHFWGERGDKTMLDAWLPASETAEVARVNNKDWPACLADASAAAEAGAEATKSMIASRGRSRIAFGSVRLRDGQR